MREDQITKLKELSEKLADVVLTDTDPDNWSGNGIAPSLLSQQERGDAYWCRKMAVASLSVLHRVNSLTDPARNGQNPALDKVAQSHEEKLLDAEISAAEREAGHLLDKMLQKERKAKFDTKVHGKP